MNYQEDKTQDEGQGLDLQNTNRINQVHPQDQTSSIDGGDKLQQQEDEELISYDDTGDEIVSLHDERDNPEGLDEQYGGDDAENQDDIEHRDNTLI